MQLIAQKEGKDAFWTFDTTVQLLENREFRIPLLIQNLQLPEFSDAYMTWNAQDCSQFQ